MKLEHENLEDLKRKILEIVGRHVDLKSHRVFFFGSRVNGKSRESSDIDVGIEGQRPLPAGALINIQEEMENLPILYKIDVVDFADVGEKFKAIAKEHIEFVN
jgi:hypothetical protein